MALISMLLLAACGATRPPKSEPVTDTITSLMSARDRARLDAIALERARQPSEADYRIGPDDLLNIRIRDFVSGTAPPLGKFALGTAVPDVEPAPASLEGQRVSARGEITIPQLGVLQVQDLTPHGLQEEIGRRLVAAGILRAPEVSVTIVEYRSGVVAVVGSVQRPGVYPLTRPGATIADLIWAAGGPNKDAGRLVRFSPVRPGQQTAGYARNAADLDGALSGGRQVASYAAGDAESAVLSDAGHARVADSTATNGRAAQPVGEGASIAAIVIDLDALTMTVPNGALNLNPQVRPGDVISIAPAGTVSVGGWVYRPGSYPITRTLTLTGAVTAAGGAIFAADAHSATVRRVLGPGEERIFEVDLDAVEQGRQPDLPIIDGDVVNLPVDGWMVVPWGFWTLVNSLLRFGATFPVT
ncbi:MAG TPA: polysaccharide biosynthesis/export family protein [Candidatus Margulisiibacteriota bacterium]|nr:polysaccharide biosynthesis/export family protein [Candidatus Margulisiibacteriota bacterium]